MIEKDDELWKSVLDGIYHHHVTPPARISLILSGHPSLLSIAPGRSSRLHPVSVQSYRIKILPGRPAFARPQEYVAYEFVTSSPAVSCMPMIYIYIYHHVVPLARISLTLSRQFSLSFIASGRSSGLHPVSSHSCWMYVRAGRPAFAWPYAGVHRSTSLMSSSLLLQQCPACLVRLAWIVFVMGGRWPYSWCVVGCCRQDLFNIALNVLV